MELEAELVTLVRLAQVALCVVIGGVATFVVLQLWDRIRERR